MFTNVDNNKKLNKCPFFDSTFDSIEMDIISLDLECFDTSAITKKDQKDIFQQLPSNIKSLLTQHRGIDTLFEWQEEILKLDCIYNGGNLIYSSPTGGGKTLVSELIILREVLSHKKDALYIVPFVSIAHEKVASLAPLGCDLGFHIEEYAGSKGTIPPRKRHIRNTIYVGTIEKCSLLINCLFEEKRMNSIGVVVVDEIHMINEESRGVTLEMLLTKIIYSQLPIQVIGMSATLKNVNDLCIFLNATYYYSNTRPIALKENLIIGTKLYSIDSSKKDWNKSMISTKEYNVIKKTMPGNMDLLLQLVLELNNHQPCLIFCPTRNLCQDVCKYLSLNLKSLYKQKERNQLIEALEYINGGVCPIIRKSAKYGVVYHHAGLADDERKLIEDAFIGGTLNILCCTSTLAAGVNLPAQRVIIKSLKVGMEYLTNATYRQMIGRAGRPGLSKYGESIIMVEKNDSHALDELFYCDRLCTSAIAPLSAQDLATIILSLTDDKHYLIKQNVISFFTKTLHYQILKKDSEKSEFLQLVEESLKYLLSSNFIAYSTNNNDDVYKVNAFGIGLKKSGINVNEYSEIITNLKLSLNSLNLNSDLHLIYISSPSDVKMPSTNCSTLHRMLSALTEFELELMCSTGLGEYEIQQYSKYNYKQIPEIKRNLMNKWLSTLIIYQMYKGRPMWDISEHYNISRGVIQQLIIASITNSNKLSKFTKEIKSYWHISILLEGMAIKITAIRLNEMVPLLEISGVKMARAKQLYQAGYKTVADVASSNIELLTSNIFHLSNRQASSIISSAKLIVREKCESLFEEAQEIKNSILNKNN